MIPEAKVSAQAPYRWVGCTVLTPQDVRELLEMLPEGSSFIARLRSTSDEAAQLAMHLDEVERDGRAT
jgi:hypothetical protein